MHTHITVTGHPIQFEQPDAKTGAILEQLQAGVDDPSVDEDDLVALVYSPQNPVMDRNAVPGRGVVTPAVLENPVYRVMTDLLYRKSINAHGASIEAMAARATITPNEAAKRLGITPSAVRQAIASGRLTAWLRDGVNYIDPAALERFELAPHGPPPAAGVERASTAPLVICTGRDGEHTLRVKAPGDVLDASSDGELQSGRVAPWRRVLVRVTNKAAELRVFVLEPGPDEAEIVRGQLHVRGRFRIAEKINNAQRAEAVWKRADVA